MPLPEGPGQQLLRLEPVIAPHPTARQPVAARADPPDARGHSGHLGAGRMHEDLADQGETTSLNRDPADGGRGSAGLAAAEAAGATRSPGDHSPGVRNLLERDLAALEPETKWDLAVARAKRRLAGRRTPCRGLAALWRRVSAARPPRLR